MLKRRQVVDGWNAEVFLYLGCRHQTVAVFIHLNIYDIATVLFHPLLLFTERTEEIFHQSPFQEGTELVHPCHLKIGKLAHLGIWTLCGGYRALLLIQVEKHLDLVADMHVFGHVTLGKKDLTFLTAVKI